MFKCWWKNILFVCSHCWLRFSKTKHPALGFCSVQNFQSEFILMYTFSVTGNRLSFVFQSETENCKSKVVLLSFDTKGFLKMPPIQIWSYLRSKRKVIKHLTQEWKLFLLSRHFRQPQSIFVLICVPYKLCPL